MCMLNYIVPCVGMRHLHVQGQDPASPRMLVSPHKLRCVGSEVAGLGAQDVLFPVSKPLAGPSEQGCWHPNQRRQRMVFSPAAGRADKADQQRYADGPWTRPISPQWTACTISWSHFLNMAMVMWPSNSSK